MSQVPLAEFARGHQPVRSATSHRVIAGALTLAIYGVFVLLWHGPFGMAPQPAPIEVVTKLVPNVPIKKLVLIPPPFLAHLIKPPVESISPPAFTVTMEAPPAPLPASATGSSLLSGGAADTNGRGATANGRSGNGSTLTGCRDMVWAQAVSDRIGLFLYYPERARRNHVTGVVMMHILVRHNGRLDSLDVLKSSGSGLLDRAAYDTVRKAEPLPAIPERMHADKVDAEMPITFGPRGEFKATESNCN